MTFNQIAGLALTEIGAYAQGETPSAGDAQDCRLRTNNMLDTWNAERLMIFQVQRQGPYNLTSGQQTYTLGPGGTFNLSSARPAKIQRMGIVSLNNPLQPLELPIDYLTVDEWAPIPVKNIQSALPSRVWDDQGFPFRTLNFWTTPNVSVQTTVYAWTPLTTFADLVTDVEFPPGYAEAIVYNLAVRLVPSYLGAGAEPSPVTAQMALEAKGRVRTMNVPILDVSCDPAITGGRGYYNWLSDEPVRSSRW